MKNMKVSAKLLLSFVVVIILAVIIGAVGIFGMYSMNKADDSLYNGNYLPTIMAGDISQIIISQRTYMRNFVIYDVNDDADMFSATEANLNQSKEDMEKLLAEYDGTIVNTDDRNAFDELVEVYNEEWLAFVTSVQEFGKANKVDEAKAALTAGASVASKMDDLTSTLQQINMNDGESTVQGNTSLFQRMTIITAAILVFAVVASLLLVSYISSLIAKPLNKIKEAAQNVADGNININIDHNSKDEIGDLANTFRTVIEILNLLNVSMKQLKAWATEGKILQRVEKDEKIKGAYHEIINGVNGIMDTFANHFNSIPVGVSIVDTAGSKLFSNPTAEANKLIDQDNIQTQTKDFADESGKTAGSLVITVDQTTVMEAQRESERQAANVAAQMKIAEKQAKYQSGEVEKLIAALDNLAKGNLNISVTHDAYDEDTQAIHDNFRKIGISLEESCTNIRSYIDELSEVLGSIADKNLNVGITREYLGDFAELKSSINNIANTLNEIFGEIAGATKQVQTGSQQVANSSQTLAQGASEQASAVEEISSTIAEVASQTKSNAENANKANEISLSAKSDAETGSHQMDEMVNAMEAIKEASKGIASIIKVIEDIAFQTNILALNAAVEAARAGEHGKGFAVVAEEVRTLAARSAAAAKETTEMIDNSLARVDVGSKIAGETASALGKIVSGVTGTVEIVATIAEASAQQATAIAQIDNGVEQISKVTQSNTATAEESASASEEMAGQAQVLQAMIGGFTLKGSKQGKEGSTGTAKPAARIPAPKSVSSPKTAPAAKVPEDDITIDLDADFGKY